MKFETILFDLDGTLLNTLTDLTLSVNHVLEDHGYPLRTEQEVRSFLGNGAKHLIRAALPAGTAEEAVEECLTEYLAYYDEHANDNTAPYEGISELIDELHRRGVKTAVLSNKGDRQVKPLVQKNFPEISLALGEREGLRRKPCTDGVEYALKELNASPGTAALMGDSEVDGQTAQNAGIAFLAAGWGFRDKDVLMQCSPVLFLEKPSDLLKTRED